MEEENKGVTLGGICRTIWDNVWVALIAFLAVTFISAVIVQYGYNPSHKAYTMEFNLVFPGEEQGVTYTFPNGEQFHYLSITDDANLRKVKESNPDFDTIDIDGLIKDNGISITRDIITQVDTMAGVVSFSDFLYTVTADAKYFKSDAQARDFLIELSKTPSKQLADMDINFDVYLKIIDIGEGISYEKEIDYLKKQLKVLEKEYDNLRTSYGDTFVVDGKTLLTYSEEVKTYDDSNILDSLLTEAKTNHYVRNDDDVQQYELELKELKEQLGVEQKTLEKLKEIYDGTGSGATVVVDSAAYKEQCEKIANLEHRIEVVEQYTAKNVSDEFDGKIETARQTVKYFTSILTSTSKDVYENSTSVIYLKPAIVSEVGGISLIKNAIISAAVGLVVALIAAYVWGYIKKSRKKKLAAEQPRTETAVEENGKNNDLSE